MAKQITEIKAPNGWVLPNLREVWHYRGVVFNMVGRNFRIRYRQTIGGPLYAVYEPLMTMVGYSILLGGLGGLPTDGDIPYPIFTFSALTVWTLFTSSAKQSSMSLFANSSLISKLYVPRLIFPVIAVAQSFVNFLITMGVLLVLMLLYGFLPTLGVIWLPLLTLLALMLALGLGLWFSALHARFRDTTYAVDFITRGLFFLTPVTYSSQVLPAPFDTLYLLNPMAVVVEGYRWALLGVGNAPEVGNLALATVVAILVLVTGLFAFRRLEMNIVDVI